MAVLPSQQSPTSWFMAQNLVCTNWQSSTDLREAIMDNAGWKFGPPTQLIAAKRESAGFAVFLGLGNSYLIKICIQKPEHQLSFCSHLPHSSETSRIKQKLCPNGISDTFQQIEVSSHFSFFTLHRTDSTMGLKAGRVQSGFYTPITSFHCVLKIKFHHW